MDTEELWKRYESGTKKVTEAKYLVVKKIVESSSDSTRLD
jgi:hypothetical protein